MAKPEENTPNLLSATLPMYCPKDEKLIQIDGNCVEFKPNPNNIGDSVSTKCKYCVGFGYSNTKNGKPEVDCSFGKEK